MNFLELLKRCVVKKWNSTSQEEEGRGGGKEKELNQNCL